MQIVLFKKIGKTVKPAEIHGKYVVGIPDLIRLVGVTNFQQFSDDIFRGAVAVAFAKDRMAAPLAGIGTAACGDQRHRSDPVVCLPNIHVVFQVNRGAVRKRVVIDLAVQ